MASAIAFALLTLMTGAVAQEYGESQGSLAVTNLLQVRGDGFTPSSAVKMQLEDPATGAIADVGTLTTDASGQLAGSISLPDDVMPGMYTLTATGVTPEGATRVLTAGVRIPGAGEESVPIESPEGIPVWLLVLLPALGLLAIGGGCWWLISGGKRRQVEQPSTTEGSSGNIGELPQ